MKRWQWIVLGVGIVLGWMMGCESSCPAPIQTEAEIEDEPAVAEKPLPPARPDRWGVFVRNAYQNPVEDALVAVWNNETDCSITEVTGRDGVAWFHPKEKMCGMLWVRVRADNWSGSAYSMFRVGEFATVTLRYRR